LINREKWEIEELIELIRKWSRIVKWNYPVAGFLKNL